MLFCFLEIGDGHEGSIVDLDDKEWNKEGVLTSAWKLKRTILHHLIVKVYFSLLLHSLWLRSSRDY